jgi:hypothetical protein
MSAVQIATSFLRTMGVPGLYRPVEVKAGAGLPYARIETPHATYIVRIRGATVTSADILMSTGEPGRAKSQSPDPAEDRLIQKLMERSGVRPPHFKIVDSSSDIFVRSFRYGRLVQGRQVFVGFQRVGIEVSFYRSGLRLSNFVGRLSLPRLTFEEPKIPKGKVIAMLKEAIVSGGRSINAFQAFQDPTLVYWASDIGTPARLCWYVPAIVQTKQSGQVRGGHRSLLLDAVTGAPIALAGQFNDRNWGVPRTAKHAGTS